MYAGIDVLSVSPRSLGFNGLDVLGVFGIFCVGRGGGGDLYRGLGFGLPLGLLQFFGELLAPEVFGGMFFSLSSLGIGGTGGTPF